MKKIKNKAVLLGLFVLSTSVFANPGITTNFSGTLTSDQTFYRPAGAWIGQLTTADLTAQTTSLYSYLAQSLIPTVTGAYNLQTTGGTVGDTFLILYSSFDPNNPMDNLIVANDDDGAGLNALLNNVSMNADTSYVLVVTSFGAGATGTIDFQSIGAGAMTVAAFNAGSYFDSTVAGGGLTPGQTIASNLDALNDGMQLTTLMNALDALDDAGVARAMETLAPSVAHASIGASSQIASGIQGIVEQRQNVGFNGLNSGEQIFSDQYIWMKPYGSFAEQNDKNGLNGFDLNAYGLGIGTDAEYAPNQKAGVAFFYTNANIDTNNVSQEADMDVYTVVTYGSIPVIDTKTKFLYQLGYSWQKTDTTRTLFDATVAKANFTAKTASIDVKLLRDYNVMPDLLVQPVLEATYRNYATPSYTETGSSGNLSMDKSKSEEFIAGIGVIVHYKLDESSNLISSLNVGYDFIGDDLTSTASFANATGVGFETNGIDNGRWNYAASFGYERNLDKNSNLNFVVGYQGEGRNYQSGSISAKYTYRF